MPTIFNEFNGFNTILWSEIAFTITVQMSLREPHYLFKLFYIWLQIVKHDKKLF